VQDWCANGKHDALSISRVLVEIYH